MESEGASWFFTCLQKQGPASCACTHTRALLPSSARSRQATADDPETALFHICTQVVPSGLEHTFQSPPHDPHCLCVLAPLSSYLQFTEVPQKPDLQSLELLISLDPPNTGATGVMKHLLPALGVCQGLEAQQIVHRLKNTEVLEMRSRTEKLNHRRPESRQKYQAPLFSPSPSGPLRDNIPLVNLCPLSSLTPPHLSGNLHWPSA